MKQLTMIRGPRSGWGGIPPGGDTGQILAKSSDDDGDVDWVPSALNVMSFGATGDGSTDDTSAIQSAISEAGTTGVVYFPAGTFLHTGITVSSNITLRGEGMNATTLKNTSDNPSVVALRTSGSGSLLNSGLFGLNIEGSRSAATSQHGVVIDSCSTGYLIDHVRCVNHGGDGFRIRAGSIGPMFTNIVARTNVGFGINAVSLDEDSSFNGFGSTSARFMFFVCSENDSGGVRINGGDSQDTDFFYFQYGLVESNGSTTSGTGGIIILNGALGPSFRDIWVEDNNDYGIFLGQDANAGGQVPLYMMFENIYFADHDLYAIKCEAGQNGTWNNLFGFGTGTSVHFTDLTNAGGHIFYNNNLDFASGGEGRSVNLIYNVIDEPYIRIEPGIRVNTLFIGDDAYAVIRTTTTTNNTPTHMTFIPVAEDTTLAFTILVAARRTDANDESAGYKLEGVIDRNSSAASTALVGTVAKTVLAEDTAAWDVDAVAETANAGLRITVTGENSKTIDWHAKIDFSRVTG